MFFLLFSLSLTTINLTHATPKYVVFRLFVELLLYIGKHYTLGNLGLVLAFLFEHSILLL